MTAFVRRFLSVLPGDDFTSNVVILGGGTAIGQAMVVLATPVITRFYTPLDMGVLGLLVAFVGFAGVGTGLRYEIAIISAKDDREANCLLAASLLISLPTSLLAGALMLAMIKFDILSYGSLPLWSIAALVAMLLFTGTFMSIRYWFVRSMDFSVISRALVAQGAGRAAVPIGVGWLHPGWVGLLLGEVAGRALGIGRMARRAYPAIRGAVIPFDLAYYADTLRRNWKFPAVVLPSSLIDALAVSLPLPVISSLFGVVPAGLFFLVMRLGTLPASLVSASVADVFHGRISETYRSDRSQVRPIVRDTARKLGAIGLAIYLPVAALSPVFLGSVLGGEWAKAGWLMTILSPLLLVALVVSPLSRLLLVIDRPEIKLISDAALLCVPLLGLYGAQRLGYDFQSCMVSFSGFHVLANILYFTLIWRSSGAGNDLVNGT